MVIALVSPALTLKERYGRLAAGGNIIPSLGLLALAAIVRQIGFRPFISGMRFGRSLLRMTPFSYIGRPISTESSTTIGRR